VAYFKIEGRTEEYHKIHQDTRHPDTESNPRSSEYEACVLTAIPRLSIDDEIKEGTRKASFNHDSHNPSRLPVMFELWLLGVQLKIVGTYNSRVTVWRIQNSLHLTEHMT
jgi:hypothetical protein